MARYTNIKLWGWVAAGAMLLMASCGRGSFNEEHTEKDLFISFGLTSLG